MKMQWQKVFIKTAVWLTAEILLNLVGIDSVADYSEFRFEQHFLVRSDLIELAIATPSNE